MRLHVPAVLVVVVIVGLLVLLLYPNACHEARTMIPLVQMLDYGVLLVTSQELSICDGGIGLIFFIIIVGWMIVRWLNK